jgi:hypothetical protein
MQTSPNYCRRQIKILYYEFYVFVNKVCCDKSKKYNAQKTTHCDFADIVDYCFCLIWCLSLFFNGSLISDLLATKGLTALPPEIDCDHTVMGLPPVTSAVFPLAKTFW